MIEELDGMGGLAIPVSLGDLE
jgi:hypothetical protein